MKAIHQLKAFEQILQHYDGSLPLHRFLPAYFKQNKQMGANDRRWATRHIYSYFRLGNALAQLSVVERLLVADFLCHEDLSAIVFANKPKWADYAALPLIEKLAYIKAQYPSFTLESVYPAHTHLSANINHQGFFQSFFKQPDLFIRVAPHHINEVNQLLKDQNIMAMPIGEYTLALPNGTKLEHILQEGTYQVQDLSSQQTGTFFQPQKWDKWWDCCAASGGKSLLLHGLEPSIDLLVSDLRNSVLANLDERFRMAGIKKYQKKELDLLQNNDLVLHHYEFDGILVDAPCTGSGTWGRTPEMLSFFEERKINQFAAIQKGILQNVVKYLKPGKPLIYITCSAFSAENEAIVEFATQNLPLSLAKMELISGYEHHADTMFVARLIKQE